MKPKIRCKNCHRKVPANPRLKHQEYCNQKPCQRARKTEWERNKIATDQDYRTNRKESREKWQENNAGYWVEYRHTHPDYCKRNRALQKLRDIKRRARHLAKMDTLNRLNQIIPGGYYIIPISNDLAKMDALMQKIFIIPDSYKGLTKSCKKGLDGRPSCNSIQCSSKEESHDVFTIMSRPGP